MSRQAGGGWLRGGRNGWDFPFRAESGEDDFLLIPLSGTSRNRMAVML
jgi:hypothetical protein